MLGEHAATALPTPVPDWGSLPDPAKVRDWGAVVAFFERAFEWDNLMYVFHPYFWGRRSRWKGTILLRDANPRFEAFLKAGAARVVVPVRPGFEAALAHFQETGDVWMGEEIPDMFGENYVSIIAEIKANNRAPGEEVLRRPLGGEAADDAGAAQGRRRAAQLGAVYGRHAGTAVGSMDLREALEQRKTWFYETQLRHLNLEAFRNVTPSAPSPELLDLISDPGDDGPVYLDSGKPVWTLDERVRHDAFEKTLTGLMGNWLDYVQPTRLQEALRGLKHEYELSAFASAADLKGALAGFPRSRPTLGPIADPPAEPDEGTGPAISRAELAVAKPWLIPELYNGRSDAATPAAWVASLEQFVSEFERDLELSLAGTPGVDLPQDRETPAAYRAWVAALLDARAKHPISETVGVRLVETSESVNEDGEKETHYAYAPALETKGSPMARIAASGLPERTQYWTGVFFGSLKECIALKPDSDMGLAHLVRLLYLYGTLPEGFDADSDLAWRKRATPDAKFEQFLTAKEAEIKADPDLLQRLRVAGTRLRILLEETAARPRSAAPTFSVLAEEVLKQGLKSYKFWLDEPLRAHKNQKLNQVKAGLGVGAEDTEMEFWSENHYIMFASSEYLLGQLWERETFQPGRAVFAAEGKIGVRKGSERRDRGRARVLKWLNNRLMFGWMEFNSSGYYREHLWALLNLVDFALDEEVRTKAEMAIDLLLFDVARYLHKGSMGGRRRPQPVQVQEQRLRQRAERRGRDHAGASVASSSTAARQVAAIFATSTYEVPEVLLEIVAAPPTQPFTDRSRVSITFDESPKYGITWSQESEAKDSLLSGYAAKREQLLAFAGQGQREIARTHDGYGAIEDDTVFFWGMSAFFNKQVVRNTFYAMEKFGLEKSEIFAPLHQGDAALDLAAALPGRLRGGRRRTRRARRRRTGLRRQRDPRRRTGGHGGRRPLRVSRGFHPHARQHPHLPHARTSMLSSLQNFRPGQLNFQSSVHQATLNGALNVFVHAGFEGSTSPTSSPVGGGARRVCGRWADRGASSGESAPSSPTRRWSRRRTRSAGDEDGPGWWTGYWALPLIVQHGGAAIMPPSSTTARDFLAETGLARVVPAQRLRPGRANGAPRPTTTPTSRCSTSADIGPKGFWLFGKVVHPVPEGSTEEPRRGLTSACSPTSGRSG